MLYISIAINLLFLIIIFLILSRGKESKNSQNLELRLKQLDSIEREVKEINSIFTIPYLRGDAGETLLNELLKNYLPHGSYSLQYGFKNGSRADAIIKTGKYIVPIDSKFPIQSIKELLLEDGEVTNKTIRTFVKHGDDIAKKYINPKEGTLNFAIMYIPSEKLFYKVFVEKETDLTGKLLAMGVVPCSPLTLFSYVQTVVYGLKGFTFNQKQNDIMEKIEALRVNYSRLDKQFQVSNGHLKNLKQSLSICEKLIDDGEDIIPG